MSQIGKSHYGYGQNLLYPYVKGVDWRRGDISEGNRIISPGAMTAASLTQCWNLPKDILVVNNLKFNRLGSLSRLSGIFFKYIVKKFRQHILGLLNKHSR